MKTLDENVAHIDALAQQSEFAQARKEIGLLKNSTRELRIAILYRPIQTLEALIGHNNDALYIEALMNLRAAIQTFKEQLA